MSYEQAPNSVPLFLDLGYTRQSIELIIKIITSESKFILTNENYKIMTTTFKIRFWKISKWFAGLFILLFVFRLIYGYVVTESTTNSDYSYNFFSSIDNLRKNYASEKMSMKGDVQRA